MYVFSFPIEEQREKQYTVWMASHAAITSILVYYVLLHLQMKAKNNIELQHLSTQIKAGKIVSMSVFQLNACECLLLAPRRAENIRKQWNLRTFIKLC